jgi:ABC-2 type transport system ATP-binding protein
MHFFPADHKAMSTLNVDQSGLAEIYFAWVHPNQSKLYLYGQEGISMTTPMAIECKAVSRHYPHFQLNNVNLSVEEGSVMGFVGPNGAGKSTTLRIIMGLIGRDSGSVTVLGNTMPEQQIAAKCEIGFISEDMRLYDSETIGFHMDFIKSIFEGWDDNYAADLLKRFDLVKEQKVKGLSHGQRVKSSLLLVLARRPRLLVFDEPTTGLDPVARHDVLNEMMQSMEDETRSILFSSHNTLDVEQISDHITFIYGGSIVDSRDKSSFLDGWRRLRLEVPDQFQVPDLAGIKEVKHDGQSVSITVSDFNEELKRQFEAAGHTIHDIERLTLEEIFLTSVQHARRASQ